MGRRGSKSLYDYCIENKFEPLLDEWDIERNPDLTPRDVSLGSSTKVWWRCSKGHIWEETVHNRVCAYRASGKGCPVCDNRMVVPGVNDLATTHPEIATQWHPTKNGELKPSDVVSGSDRRVWWICEKGHEWEASLLNRARQGTGCPYCAKQRVWPGESFADTHPEIAAQWHPTKNGELKPSDVLSTTTRKIWWQCDEGHEWMKAVCRFVKDSSCPICAAKLDDELDVEPKPSKAKADSSAKVLCQCDKGHEKDISVAENPKCAGKETEEERYMRLVDLILAGK